MLLNVIIISISLSLDALGIGISYKLKGVKITTAAKLLVGLVSVMIMWVSLQAGYLILQWFPKDVANLIGAAILAIIGLSFIRNGLYGSEEAVYDFNRSKKIDWWEALVLGIALSADSFSAGVAAASIGFHGVLIPLSVGFMQVLFLFLADIMMSHCNVVKNLNRKLCGVVSGLLLLMIALIRLI